MPRRKPAQAPDPAAVSLGRRGGQARAESLSKKRRVEIARKAGEASGKARKKRARLIKRAASQLAKIVGGSAFKPRGTGVWRHVTEDGQK